MSKFTYSFISLDSDYRGAYFANQYFSLKEEANIEGCVFLNCKFDNQSSLERAIHDGVCVKCAVETNLNKPRYAQAQVEVKTNLMPSCVFYAKNEDSLKSLELDTYTDDEDGDEFDDDELDEWADNNYSLTTLGKDAFVDYSSDENNIVKLGYEYSKEFGSIDLVSFNSDDRLYARYDGELSYDGFVFLPPPEESMNVHFEGYKAISVFTSDGRLDELECSLYDIQDAIANIELQMATEQSRQNLQKYLEDNEDYFEDEINTFGDSTEILRKYLSERDITTTMAFILSNGRIRNCEYIMVRAKEYLFQDILRFFNKFNNKGLRYNGLLLDDEVLILNEINSSKVLKLE